MSEVLGPEATSSLPSATTNFTNTGDTVISDVVQFTPLDTALLSNAETSTEQTIHDFLMKPYRFATGSLASTDNSSTFVSYKLPEDVTDLPIYANKLSGFLGMRADIVVRFQVNANKFQQGRYILCFAPSVGSGTSTLAAITGMRWANLTTITQLPHVEIDLSLESEAILKIPYVAITSHLAINPATPTSNGVLGYLRIFPYSPLVSVAGSTTASYDLYVNFENISLAAPCVPQMSKFVSKRNNITTEQQNHNVGPVQGTAQKISKVANLIGDKVPALSFLAQPVSWASDLMAGVASVFGWSKPINLGPAERLAITTNAYAGNCDAIDNSMPLSLFAQNQIEVLPGFAGNDIDEMSIDFLKSIPAYYKTITWTTSNVAGDILMTESLTPITFITSFTSGVKTALCHTPVAMLGQLFGYYRGGLRFTFKIVKTEFHSGRIAVTFNPLAPYQANASVSATDAPYVHREILDIREGNSFDFIVPYVSLTPYKNRIEPYGNITMSVINPLIAPATVSSSIKFLVEVAGAPDLEFAFPNTDFEFFPTVVYNPQSSKFIPKADKNSLTSAIMGKSELKHDNFISSRACVGEKIVSMLSYMKRLSYIGTSTSAAITLNPQTINVAYTTAGTWNASSSSDMVSLVSSFFALSRGSMRYKTIPTSTTSTNYNAFHTLRYDAVSTSVFYLGAGTVSYLNKPCLAITNNQGGNEIQIPAYNNCHSRSVYDCFKAATLGVDNTKIGNTSYILTLNTPDGATNTANIFRAVGDDFQLGYFVGIPPITFS